MIIRRYSDGQELYQYQVGDEVVDSLMGQNTASIAHSHTLPLTLVNQPSLLNIKVVCSQIMNNKIL